MAIDTAALVHAPEFDALCDDAKSRISELSVDDVAQMMDAGEAFCFIDVRDVDEFEKFRIKGAQFLSKGWIEAKIHKFAPSKDEKIVLYCGGGNRSALAADNLQKMGYNNVHSMIGGIKGWVNSGKAVIEG